MAIGFSLLLAPQTLADVGDTCKNQDGIDVDQLCNIAAGELCVDGLCAYVSLEEGGTGLSIPTGNVQLNDSINQKRSLPELVTLIVNSLLGFLGLVATVVIIYAGVLWVISAGNDDLVGKAKKTMTYAAIGIVVILISFAAVTFITGVAGGGGDSGDGGGGGGGNAPENQGFQCEVTSDCGEGQYCFNNQCNNSLKVNCQDDSQCGQGEQCSPLGFCFDPNSGSGFACENDSDCNLGFVCNLGTSQCDLGGSGQGGGILGDDFQAQADEALDSVDDLLDALDGEVEDINDQIDSLPQILKNEVISTLDEGFIGDKKAGIQALLEETDDPATIQLLEQILTYLERLEDLRGEMDDLQAVMPESAQTIDAYDEASLSLDEAMDDPRSTIKSSRFGKDYNDLKLLIRQFPVVESRIRALPGEGNVPFTVTFNGLDSIDPTGGTIADYNWSFLNSEGEIVSLGNDPVVVHTFTEPNSYAVRLQVSTSQTDDEGYKRAMDGVSVVRVKANPPAANVDFKLNGKNVIDVYHVTLEEAQNGLSFDPSETTPAFGRTIDQYEWLFGDGNVEIRSTPSTVVHTYPDQGEYVMTLKIRDNTGVEDRKVVKLILKPLAADIDVSPLQGDVNTPFTFRGTGSRSDNGSINRYEWEVLDENGEVVDRFEDPELRYRFERPGNYEIALTVTDTSGQTDRAVRTLTVDSREPVANFNYRIPENNHPNTFEFDASTSYDPDEGDELTYSWDFDGDGAFEIIESTEFLASHTYRQTGTFQAVLQVQDRFGERQQNEQNITVDSTLSGDIVLEKKSFRVDEQITFQASSPGAVAYLWDFGDGQNASTEEDQITHAYQEKGKYEVTLKFFDRNDNNNSHTITILVGDQDVPLALAEARVGEYTPLLQGDVCEPGKNAMVISRNDRVMFNAAESVNTDGTSRLLDYNWVLSEDVQNTSRDFSYRFTQLTPGTQCASAILRVRDQLSGRVSEADTLYFKVVNELPTLSDFVIEPISEELVTPTKVNLKAIGATDVDGEIRQYRWWYFREGSEQEKLGVHSTTTPETQMTITAEGEPGAENRYVFVVEMTDNDGGKWSSLETYGETSQLDIVNGPNLSPVAEFVVDKTTISVGDSVSFISKSYDPQGDTLPSSAFRWDFDGDGSFDDTTSGDQVNYTYNTPGQFEARLNVQYQGLSSSVTHTINVEATNSYPQAAFTYTTQSNTVQFSALNSRANPNGERDLTYEWDFNTQQDSNGNGQSDDDVDSTQLEPTFTYPQPGRYSARLKVSDGTGAQGVVVRQVNLGVSAIELEENTHRSLGISSLTRPMTQLTLTAAPVSLDVGASTDIYARVENADQTPYKGEVFFEILSGSGEMTPNPALGSAAAESQAIGTFTATASGPVRVRVKATGTFHGTVTEDIVLRVN